MAADTNNESGMSAMMKAGIGVPVGLVAILAMMILPLPAFMLDVLFTFNIALSLVIVMAVFNVKRPLDFAIFPTVLLLVTLLRLALITLIGMGIGGGMAGGMGLGGAPDGDDPASSSHSS